METRRRSGGWPRPGHSPGLGPGLGPGLDQSRAPSALLRRVAGSIWWLY